MPIIGNGLFLMMCVLTAGNRINRGHGVVPPVAGEDCLERTGFFCPWNSFPLLHMSWIFFLNQTWIKMFCLITTKRTIIPVRWRVRCLVHLWGTFPLSVGFHLFGPQSTDKQPCLLSSSYQKGMSSAGPLILPWNWPALRVFEADSDWTVSSVANE